MRAGEQDRKLELQSKSAATPPDPTSGTWTTQATVWGKQMDPRSVERFAGKQFLALASQAFAIPYRTDVNPTWRVKENTNLWRIVGTPEGPGRRRETVLLVERFNPNDVAA